MAYADYGRLAPQLSFQKLELFCCVANLRSVTRAAEKLGVAQPAVTAQLRGLEDKLGVRLVYRDGRNLGLTETGVRFHRWCEETLTRCSELSRELSGLAGGTTGSAVIAASMSAGSYQLADILAAFQTAFPKTKVSTRISNTGTATEDVRIGACDFAVLLLDREQDLEGLEFELLWNEPLALVAAPDDDRVGDTATPTEISQLPFVSTPRLIIRRTIEDEMLYACGLLTRDIVMELGHPEAVKRVVRQKIGVTFIEKSSVREDIARGELREVATPQIDLKLPFYLAYRRGKSLSEMQLRLMDFIRQAARAL